MIETERLILRGWRTDDAEALYKYASDRRVSELALWPCHDSIDMSREVIKDIFAPNPYSFAMVLKDTGEPIGCIGLVPHGDEHYSLAATEREVGYWIGYPYWGMGLTTEALRGLIEFCCDSLICRSLLITTDAQNTASQRVAEKCGFKFLEDYMYEGVSGKAYRLHLKVDVNPTLRPYQPTDANVITTWLKSKYLMHQWCADIYEYPVTPDDINKYYERFIDGINSFALTMIDGDEIVGYITLRRLGGHPTELRLGFVIVDDSKRGRGLGKVLVRMAVDYAFGRLGATKVSLAVFENNPAAIHCYESVGFLRVVKQESESYKCLGETWNCIEMEYRRDE